MDGWCAMELADDLRPPVLDDCRNPTDCHGHFLSFEQSLKPWPTSSTERWSERNPEGDFVIVPAGTGMTCNAESADASSGHCAFTEEDIDIYFEDLEAALALAEPDDSKILSATWSMGEQPPEALFELWLERMDPYVARGEVGWATVPEIVDWLQR